MLGKFLGEVHFCLQTEIQVGSALQPHWKKITALLPGTHCCSVCLNELYINFFI